MPGTDLAHGAATRRTSPMRTRTSNGSAVPPAVRNRARSSWSATWHCASAERCCLYGARGGTVLAALVLSGCTARGTVRVLTRCLHGVETVLKRCLYGADAVRMWRVEPQVRAYMLEEVRKLALKKGEPSPV
eukprot:3879566-Rhodomonas_salina.2